MMSAIMIYMIILCELCFCFLAFGRAEPSAAWWDPKLLLVVLTDSVGAINNQQSAITNHHHHIDNNNHDHYQASQWLVAPPKSTLTQKMNPYTPALVSQGSKCRRCISWRCRRAVWAFLHSGVSPKIIVLVWRCIDALVAGLEHSFIFPYIEE